LHWLPQETSVTPGVVPALPRSQWHRIFHQDGVNPKLIGLDTLQSGQGMESFRGPQVDTDRGAATLGLGIAAPLLGLEQFVQQGCVGGLISRSFL
jgi:hypothetical protein